MRAISSSHPPRLATWTGRAPRVPSELLVFGWFSVAFQLGLASFLLAQWLRGRASPELLLASICLFAALKDLRPLSRGRGRSRGAYTGLCGLAIGLGALYVALCGAALLAGARAGSGLDARTLVGLVFASAGLALGLWLARLLRRPDVALYFAHFERRELRRKRLASRPAAVAAPG
ncbi:MAG: hypothetical protein IT453_13735 [Planctomycetes bacterium]|nr:hypothetical protein [Planctomycetota bacterium]